MSSLNYRPRFSLTQDNIPRAKSAQLKAQISASAAAPKAAKVTLAAAHVKIAQAVAMMDSAQKEVLAKDTQLATTPCA